MVDCVGKWLEINREVKMDVDKLRKGKVIYVAGPYTKGDVAVNVRRSMHFGDILLRNNLVPVLPLLSHFWHIVSPKDYDVWTTLDLAMVLKCDALFRMEGESLGADAEVMYARDHDILVFDSLDALLAWADPEEHA